MHRSELGELGELYTSLKKNHACFNRFDIERSNAQTSKNYISLNSPAHKEYKNLCLMSIDSTKPKQQALIYDAVEIKYFIVISLMKQNLFLVTLIDIGTKLFLD